MAAEKDAAARALQEAVAAEKAKTQKAEQALHGAVDAERRAAEQALRDAVAAEKAKTQKVEGKLKMLSAAVGQVSSLVDSFNEMQM